MDYKHYKYIRMLAWDILIDLKITSFPLRPFFDFKKTKVYNLLDTKLSTFENVNIVSNYFLDRYGLNQKNDIEIVKMLTVRLMTPMCILKECNIKNINELEKIFLIPKEYALQRLKRFELIKIRDKFYISNSEIKLVKNCSEFIKMYKSLNK